MFFKKRKEEKDMATYEEVKAAYEKLSEEDKGKFKQSLEAAAGEGEGEPWHPKIAARLSYFLTHKPSFWGKK